MNRHERAGEPQQRCVLLIDICAEEQEALARGLPQEPGVCLRAVTTAAEAAAAVDSTGVEALLCSFSAFRSLAEALPERFREQSPLPTLVLVPSGAEESAAGLLERDNTDVLLRQGDYLPLLPAWLRRALERRQAAWEEVGRIVRHEINNPLTGVLGNAELILAEPAPLPLPVRARLRTIINLAVRMCEVVRTLEERRLGRSDPNGGPRPPDVLDPSPLAQELTR
jgi:signal transduction histidine kinase